jgi:transposase
MPAINKQAIWSRNHHGKAYKKGVGEEGLWCNIVELSEGGKSKADIINMLRCSHRLVDKVLKKYKEDPTTIPTPKKNGGYGTRAHSFKNYVKVAKDFLASGGELKHVVAHLVTEVGPSFHPSTAYRHAHTDLKQSLQKGRKVDPRKFSDENMAYYLDYLHFQTTIAMDIDKALEVKTFDECKVAQTGSYINFAINNNIYLYNRFFYCYTFTFAIL